ncbi:hypothetical protein M1D72_05835 [Vibrio sp. AK197]|uniref:hypothetical protein n=1 Tax=Vibrio alginolyticus TaxID=663 RepID=UPI001BD50060|nr:hypothetical protein [Vibrio alginolyticus]MBS9830279.1 hypothetical protein [Vibrio alginolyticus]
MKWVIHIMAFFISVCAGIWFGVERVTVAVDAIPQKDDLDVLTSITSVMSFAASTAALIIAAKAYYRWRYQAVHQHKIQAVIDTIKSIAKIKSLMSEVVLFRGDSFETEKLSVKLSGAISELDYQLDLYYVLDATDGDQEFRVLNKMLMVDDIMKNTKHYKELAFDFNLMLNKNALNVNSDCIQMNSVVKHLSLGPIIRSLSDDYEAILTTYHIDKSKLNAKLHYEAERAIQPLSEWL